MPTDAYTLDRWSVVDRLGNMIPPEQPHFAGCLVGRVLNHPRRPDNTLVKTSCLLGYNADTDTFITHNESAVTLGTVYADYEAVYPRARARLVDTVNTWEKKQ